MAERFGVIGLGRMGSAMAQRMAAMGCSTRGWTRSGRSIDGVKTASDLRALVAGSDTIRSAFLTMRRWPRCWTSCWPVI